MQKTASWLGISLLVFAALAFGAAPLGKASSAEPFQLRGAQVPVAGVPSWPLTDGDEIGATSAPVALTLRDGSKVVLAKGSRAKVGLKDGKLVLRLLQGAGEYALASNPQLLLFVKDKPANIEPGGKGFVSLDGSAGQRSAAAALGSQGKPMAGPMPPPLSQR